MTGAILRKELRALLRDGRFAVLALLGLGLLATVLVASERSQARRSAERLEVEALVRAQWDHQGDKHPHRGAHFGLYAFRPEAPAMHVDPGIGPHVGQALWLEPHRRNLPRSPEAADALPSARFAAPTPAFVLVVLFPLLLVAFGFDAVSQERESGTLRMLQGGGGRPGALLAGKLAVLVLAAATLALLPLAATLALSPAQLSVDGACRLAALAACLLLYYACMAALVLAVSARCGRGLSALYLLLAGWVLAAFILPGLAALAARAAVPLPGSAAFWAAIQEDYAKGLPGDGDLATRGRRFDAELLRRHGVSRLEDLPVGAAPLRRLERDAYADKVHALHFARLWERFERQEDVVRAFALLDPVLAMRNVAMKLAGTDLSHQRHFEQEAERYRQALNRAIDEWDARSTRGMTSFESRYADNRLWQSVPAFTYRPPPLAFAVSEAGADLLVLAVWTLAAAALLRASARRIAP